MQGRYDNGSLPNSVGCLFVWMLAMGSCLSCPVARAAAGEPVALLRDGRTIAVQLSGMANNGDWIFKSAGETVSVARDQLVLWGAYRDHSDRSWILLRDGSLLVADLLGIEKDAVVVAGRMWPETRLPRPLVRAIVFRPPLDSLARDALVARSLSEVRAEDCLLFEHGDELRGRAPDTVQPEPGAFHPEKIRWPVRGSLKPVELSLQRIVALLFATDGTLPSGAGVDTAVVGTSQWVGLNDGSRLLVTHVARTKESLAFTLSTGMQLGTEADLSGANPYDAVVFLQPIGTKVRYLSDIEPVGYKHIPYFVSSWTYRRDRSVAGGQLRASDGMFLKGVGMHSSSRLAYDLPEGYHELQAELAIDQRAGRDGSVIFRVYLQDQAGEWNKAFESDVVRGGQPLVPLRLKVQNAVRVALIVDCADRADQWDHANWLNLRLTR